MKTLITTSLIFFSLSFSIAQTKMHFSSGCHYMHATSSDDKFITDPSLEADSIFNKLLSESYLRGRIKLKMSTGVENALATIGDNGEKYILYSEAFLGQLKNDSKNIWVVYSVLAHEIGHHLHDHDFEETDPVRRKEMELEADKFSGEILNSLCASYTDALLALEVLKTHNSPKSKIYPSLPARKDFILQGWVERNEDEIQRHGTHPCNRSKNIDLKFTNYGSKNKSKNVKAMIYPDHMLIKYDSKIESGDLRNYTPYIVIDSDSPLKPKTIKWSDKVIGDQNIAIWEFEKDGYTSDQVHRADEIGVVVFKKNKMPKPVKIWEWLASSSAIIGGGYFSFYKGPKDMKAACDLYDTYSNHRNPNDPVYLELGLTRKKTLTDSESNYKNALGWKTIGGGVVFAGGATWMIINVVRQKKSKKGRFYADIPPPLKIEPFVLVEGGGGVSLRYSF